MSSLHQNVITLIGAADTLSQLIQIMMIIILGRIIIVSARQWANVRYAAGNPQSAGDKA